MTSAGVPVGQRRGWRWRNVPVPEAHLGVGAAALVLSRLRPWRLPWPTPVIGWPLIIGGTLGAGWATAAPGSTDLARPGRLVTTGPYATSRHPMYVAWTVGYVGVALTARSGWLLASTPLLAVLVHRDALGEEARLEGLFGHEYRAYRAGVRRYL